jgi:hypothetical protein
MPRTATAGACGRQRSEERSESRKIRGRVLRPPAAVPYHPLVGPLVPLDGPGARIRVTERMRPGTTGGDMPSGEMPMHRAHDWAGDGLRTEPNDNWQWRSRGKIQGRTS